MEENFGPGVARNVGFKTASQDRILFIDNDVSLDCSCPDRLVQALDENPKAAVVMPRVLYAHDRDMIQYDGADSHFLGLMILHNVNRPLSVSVARNKKIGSLVTACFLIDRSRWKGEVPFDESFFFNYEDYDFGLRTRILGHEILSVPFARCYHREGTKGLSFREGGGYSKRRVFCLIRNRWQVILKNYELKTLVLLIPVFIFYEIFQLVGVIKKGWFAEWAKALFWTIRHFPQILEKRQLIQKSRKIPDREILKDGSIPFTVGLTQSPLERIGKRFLDFLSALYWKRVSRFI